MKINLSKFVKKFLGRARRAETLVEVVMAIFVVSIGATASTNLIVSALQANSFSRDNLIALNLAQEGLEAMRNIRDTNWIKFGSDKEHCWNMRPVTVDENGDPVACDSTKLIQRNSYTVDLNPKSMMWTLSAAAGWLNLNEPNGNDDYRLSFIKMGNKDNGLYVSQKAITAFGDQVTTTSPSKFYRVIGVSYEKTPDPNGSSDADKSQEMNVTSLVQWKDGTAVHQVQLSATLSNYQKPKPQQ